MSMVDDYTIARKLEEIAREKDREVYAPASHGKGIIFYGWGARGLTSNLRRLASRYTQPHSYELMKLYFAGKLNTVKGIGEATEPFIIQAIESCLVR